MDEQELKYLRKRHKASKWLGRQRTKGTVMHVELTESDISGWTRARAERYDHATPPFDHATPPFFHSVWTKGGNADKIITVRIIECRDASAAQHQLLKELGTFHLPTIERHDSANAIGDVSFGIGKTTALFARANVVVTILNASPPEVSVVAVARAVDAFINRKIRESP